MKKLIGAVAVAAAVCGCVSTDVYRDGDVEPQRGLQDHSANPYKINYSLAQQRVKGSGHSECWFWFFSCNDGRHMDFPGFCLDAGVASAKESATFDAVEKARADALMGATYRYTKTSKCFGIYKSVDCEVLGFPAVVNGIEKLTDRPVLIHKDDQLIRLKPWETLQSASGSSIKLEIDAKK